MYDQLLTDDAVWLCLDYPAADYVFLLSAAEVRELYTEKAQEISRDSLDDGFGLSFTRTIGVGVGKSNEVLATPSGKYFDLIPWNDGPWAGPSPALNVDLSSILFASESGMTKSSALAPVTDMTSNAWKLTLLDGSKTVGVTDGKTVTKANVSGKTKYTVPYTYSGKDVSQISVMITDRAYDESGAQILYYGALQDVNINQTTGTGTFTLPDNLPECYKIYIIAEDVNAAKKNDYAGPPFLIESANMLGGNKAYTVTVNNGSGGGEYKAGETVTITAREPEEGEEFAEWIVKDGEIELEDEWESTTSFTMPAYDVEVTAEYEADDPEDGTETENNGNGGGEQKPAETITASEPEEEQCVHRYEWRAEREATEIRDAEEAYVCKFCGKVKFRMNVANSAYALFNKNAVSAIDRASKGAEVTIETTQWVSFQSSVIEMLKSRSDVTLVINYLYNGVSYTVTIPAGADLKALEESEGYYGFRYLDLVFAGHKIK